MTGCEPQTVVEVVKVDRIVVVPEIPDVCVDVLAHMDRIVDAAQQHTETSHVLGRAALAVALHVMDGQLTEDDQIAHLDETSQEAQAAQHVWDDMLRRYNRLSEECEAAL